MIAVSSVGVDLLVKKPRTRARLTLSAPVLGCTVALFFAVIHEPPNERHRFAREAEHTVAAKRPSDRQEQATAILDRWFDGSKPTTINCAPNADIGTYRNGLQLGVAPCRPVRRMTDVCST